MDELADVVYRRKLTVPLSKAKLTPSQVVEQYRRLSLLVLPASIRRTVSDADDDVVLGTAKAAQAGLIVSGDRHLLALKSFGGIPIVNVADALLRIEAVPL